MICGNGLLPWMEKRRKVSDGYWPGPFFLSGPFLFYTFQQDLRGRTVITCRFTSIQQINPQVQVAGEGYPQKIGDQHIEE